MQKSVDIRTGFEEGYKNGYQLIAEDVPLIDAPLWWHDKGLQQTASGYGSKLTTRYKVEFEGKQRRIYCTCFSNSGSLWFTAKGKKYFCN